MKIYLPDLIFQLRVGFHAKLGRLFFPSPAQILHFDNFARRIQQSRFRMALVPSSSTRDKKRASDLPPGVPPQKKQTRLPAGTPPALVQISPQQAQTLQGLFKSARGLEMFWRMYSDAKTIEDLPLEQGFLSSLKHLPIAQSAGIPLSLEAQKMARIEDLRHSAVCLLGKLVPHLLKPEQKWDHQMQHSVCTLLDMVSPMVQKSMVFLCKSTAAQLLTTTIGCTCESVSLKIMQTFFVFPTEARNPVLTHLIQCTSSSADKNASWRRQQAMQAFSLLKEAGDFSAFLQNENLLRDRLWVVQFCRHVRLLQGRISPPTAITPYVNKIAHEAVTCAIHHESVALLHIAFSLFEQYTEERKSILEGCCENGVYKGTATDLIAKVFLPPPPSNQEESA